MCNWIEMRIKRTLNKNKIRGIYNHAQYIEDRTKMMQWYSDLFTEPKR